MDLKLKMRVFSSEKVIHGYSDSDWGSDYDHVFITGYCFFVFNSLVSWNCKKQATVTLSSTEAEYYALTETAKEAIWIRNLLVALSILIETECVNLYGDNNSAMLTTQNQTHHKRMKHVDIKYHFIREKVLQKTIQIHRVLTENQIADIFTKPLDKAKFLKHRAQLGLA